MKKISLKTINKKAVDSFCKDLANIDRTRDIKKLLQDLMSSSEIKDIARRLEAAKLLKKGKTYQDIQILLSMSPLTINKVYFKTKGSKIINKLS